MSNGHGFVSRLPSLEVAVFRASLFRIGCVCLFPAMFLMTAFAMALPVESTCFDSMSGRPGLQGYDHGRVQTRACGRSSDEMAGPNTA